VDILKVFSEYQKTKDYDKKLEKKKNEVENKLNAKKESIEKMQNKLELLKEEAKEKEQKKMSEAIKDYRELERKGFGDIKEMRDEKMKEIIEDINKVVENYAKKNNFNLMLNQSAVLYGDKVMDVTKDVLNISNKKYKEK